MSIKCFSTCTSPIPFVRNNAKFHTVIGDVSFHVKTVFTIAYLAWDSVFSLQRVCWRAFETVNIIFHSLNPFIFSSGVHRSISKLKLILKSIALKHIDVWLGMLMLGYECLILVSDGVVKNQERPFVYLIGNEII